VAGCWWELAIFFIEQMERNVAFIGDSNAPLECCNKLNAIMALYMTWTTIKKLLETKIFVLQILTISTTPWYWNKTWSSFLHGSALSYFLCLFAVYGYYVLICSVLIIIILSRLIVVAKYSNDTAQQGRTKSIHKGLVSGLFFFNFPPPLLPYDTDLLLYFHS